MKALEVGLLPRADFLPCQVVVFGQLLAKFPSQNLAFLDALKKQVSVLQF